MIESGELNNRRGLGRRRLLKPVEVARYWRLNVKTVYRRVQSGDLPAIRLPDGQLRIDEQDAMSYGRRIAIEARRTTVDTRGQ